MDQCVEANVFGCQLLVLMRLQDCNDHNVVSTVHYTGYRQNLCDNRVKDI